MIVVAVEYFESDRYVRLVDCCSFLLPIQTSLLRAMFCTSPLLVLLLLLMLSLLLHFVPTTQIGFVDWSTRFVWLGFIFLLTPYPIVVRRRIHSNVIIGSSGREDIVTIAVVVVAAVSAVVVVVATMSTLVSHRSQYRHG